MRHLFHGIIIGIALAFLLSGCGKDSSPTNVGFYHWQGAFILNDYERRLLQESESDKLYLRIFDVDFTKQGGILPIGKLLVKDSIPTDLEIVPVIYITQSALKASKSLDSLAVKLIGLACFTLTQEGIVAKEVQFDCDWTQSSKSQYFELLEAIRRQPWMKGKLLSCTIRLHQIKYKLSTGVPPVDRGMLMCYNMGSMLQLGEHNSIFQWPEMKTYIKDIKTYKLPLDIVLPIYSWILLFDGKKFKGIIYGNDALLRHPSVKRLGKNRFEIGEDFDFQRYHFRKGETLRHEAAEIEAVAPLWKFIRENHKPEAYTLSLYHLDSASIADFGKDNVLGLMRK